MLNFIAKLTQPKDTPTPPTVTRPAAAPAAASHATFYEDAGARGSAPREASAMPWHASPAAPGVARVAAAALRRLQDFDTVFVVDDSVSMRPLWSETRQGLMHVVEAAVQYDSDGVDLYFLNSSVCQKNIRSAQQLAQLFEQVQPSNGTPTGAALKRVIDPYLAALRVAGTWPKPLNVIVITDGAANDAAPADQLEATLVRFARRLDALGAPAQQLGIQFFVVGNDAAARRAVGNLDDALPSRYKVRDIVDSSSLRAAGSLQENIMKILLGAVDPQFDAQGNAALRPWEQ